MYEAIFENNKKILLKYKITKDTFRLLKPTFVNELLKYYIIPKETIFNDEYDYNKTGIILNVINSTGFENEFNKYESDLVDFLKIH